MLLYTPTYTTLGYIIFLHGKYSMGRGRPMVEPLPNVSIL